MTAAAPPPEGPYVIFRMCFRHHLTGQMIYSKNGKPFPIEVSHDEWAKDKEERNERRRQKRREEREKRAAEQLRQLKIDFDQDASNDSAPPEEPEEPSAGK